MGRECRRFKTHGISDQLFSEMAWNPKQFNAKNLLEYTEKWAAQQFGEKHAKEIAGMINLYAKYNRRVTPETLDSRTYSLQNYHEFETVLNDYRALSIEALRLKNRFLPNTRMLIISWFCILSMHAAICMKCTMR